MSLGIRSIWRTRLRCIGTPGSFSHPAHALHPRAPFVAAKATRHPFATMAATTDTTTTTTTTDSPPLEPSPDAELSSSVSAELVETNHKRNKFFRDSFRVSEAETPEEIERMLASAYVPTARTYPSISATRASMEYVQKIARVQVGFDTIGRSFSWTRPHWSVTLNLLKKITPKQSEKPRMAAMRIVLPKSWDIAVSNKRVDYVDSSTGLAARLRVSMDHHNPSGIVLRGKSSVLAKAADEIVAACNDVQVFKLGDLATYDYEARRLWPAIEGAPDDGSSLPADKEDNIWIHKEFHTYWIDQPYEKTPKPTEWTTESFETYITALVCGQLRPHLAVEFYAEHRKNGKFIDTDGVRVRLITQAFKDPAAKVYITPAVLKMALSFMVHKGGHRAEADRLFKLAEEWGVPMDTDVFNIVLDGYTSKRDVSFFHRVLVKMEKRYFAPNAKTWLLFLKLVQKDDERRQVIAAMYEQGLFEDPATRRGIARTMASSDAYTAFKAGKSPDAFMAEQTTRYGEDWFTVGALNSILREFFRFHDCQHPLFHNFKSLIERQSADGQQVDISTVNLVLKYCSEFGDWKTSLWVLERLPSYGCEPDPLTYHYIIMLAIKTHSPNSLGVAFMHAVLSRKLRHWTRLALRPFLLGQTSDSFWDRSDVRVKIFSKQMGKKLELDGGKIVRLNNMIAGIEWAILSTCGGYQPSRPLAESLSVTFRTLDRELRREIKSRRGQQGTTGPLDLSPFRSRNFTLRLVKPDSEQPKMMVHIDGQFVPRTMVKNWSTRRHSADLLDEANAVEEATMYDPTFETRHEKALLQDERYIDDDEEEF